MLYDNENREVGLIKKEKLNIKKVILFIAIVFACFLIMFGSFYISYQKLVMASQNQEMESAINSNTNEKHVITQKKVNKKDKHLAMYEGNHMQIANHDIEMIQNNFIPQANPNAQQMIKDIYFSDEKQVYLTFDDGPSKDITPQILDILKENNIKATFFVLGARVELYPDMLKREFEEGHYIANHGYSHQYSSVYENEDKTFQEYVDCENAIKKALNNQKYNSYLFRFPGGSTGGYYSEVKQKARELFSNYGVAYTNWNCLTGDAAGNTTKEACMNEMISTKENQNSIILLMHDANDKTQTVEALPDIIQYFKNEGYTFKNFYEIF